MLSGARTRAARCTGGNSGIPGSSTRPRGPTVSAIDPVAAQLRAAGCVFAEDEAALLRAAAGGAGLQRLVARRVAGEPLEQVLGWASFRGLRIAVAPGVFVPRRRTEFLVEVAVGLRPALAVDLCCGTGAVAAAIAAELPGAEVYAADVDPDAVRCARCNLEPSAVFQGDLFEALPDRLQGRIGVLTANAPYVPSDELELMPREARLYEARNALDGGVDGLDLHRRIIAGAAEWLAAGGTLLVETSRRQLEQDLDLCAAAGWQGSAEHSDAHDSTVLVARPRQGRSAEAAVHVVGGARVVRVLEDLRGVPCLDDVTRGVVRGEEERARLRHARGLLHVVRDDDDGDLPAQLGDRLLDTTGGGRV